MSTYSARANIQSPLGTFAVRYPLRPNTNSRKRNDDKVREKPKLFTYFQRNWTATKWHLYGIQIPRYIIFQYLFIHFGARCDEFQHNFDCFVCGRANKDGRRSLCIQKRFFASIKTHFEPLNGRHWAIISAVSAENGGNVKCFVATKSSGQEM